jgi:hypothetical protein
MLDALARSIAETAADVLRGRATQRRAKVSDEEIGLHLWHERGFRDHETLVALINHTRVVLDRPQVARPGTVSCQPVARLPTVRASEAQSRPVQLALDLVTA